MPENAVSLGGVILPGARPQVGVFEHSSNSYDFSMSRLQTFA